MGRLHTAVLAWGLVAAAFASPADEQSGGYDGTNPFDCVLQQVGTGTDFPDPEADPFCVEYDKRHQNVTQAGVVDFLSQEPARVAAASDKCFYFQHDHWRGSIVQDDERTETYSWDGSYFFDKAKGTGGAYVENYTFNNRTGDPTQAPGFPAEYKPYFGNGRGGFQQPNSFPADPRCIEKAKEKSPYKQDDAKPPPRRPCAQPNGEIGKRIGKLRLGMRRGDALKLYGGPAAKRRGFLRYCAKSGGKLMAGFPSGKASAQAEFLLTSNPGYSAHGVRRLTPEKEARRRLKREFVFARRAGATLWGVRERGILLLVGVRDRRVHLLAVASARLSYREALDYYLRSR